MFIAAGACETLVLTKIEEEIAINFNHTKYRFYLKSLEVHVAKINWILQTEGFRFFQLLCHSGGKC